MDRRAPEVYRKKGVRLNADVSPLLQQHFYAPMRGKAWKGFQMFDKAHTVMLTEEGIIPRKAGVAILSALRKMEGEGVEKVRHGLGGHMHCGEAYATQTIGPELAGWIHAGRSSGDLRAVGGRVDAREIEIAFMKGLIQIKKTLLRRAEEHIGTVMPGYTHLQHAEPITFGFYLLSFVHHLERDLERFQAAYRHTNVSPAGCAILTTTDFPIRRERTQELLGFDGLLENAKDAIWAVDYLMECLSAIMCLASTLTRLADDLDIWHSSEFKLVDIPDEFCGTSSIMPQKKNPHGTEGVRGLSGDVIGSVMAFFAQTNHQSDSSEMLMIAPLSLYRAADNALAALQIMDGILGGLRVHGEIMAERAAMHWTQAASLANSLMREQGIPFRTAHQIVAVLVRLAYEQEKTPASVSTAMLDAAAEEIIGRGIGLGEENLREALDVTRIVRSKKVIGGTAPERVEEDLWKRCERGKEEERIVADMEAKLSAAERRLLTNP